MRGHRTSRLWVGLGLLLAGVACSAGGTDAGNDGAEGVGGSSSTNGGSSDAVGGASVTHRAGSGGASAGASSGAAGSTPSHSGSSGVAGAAGASAAGASAAGAMSSGGASGASAGHVGVGGSASGAGAPIGESGSAGVSGASGAVGGSGATSAGQGGAAGFATCATGEVAATTTLLPVDIIWVVDNSASMAPAVSELTMGINDFAAQIGQMSLDYRVVMLSLQGTQTMTIDGKIRYPVCVPPPLAGDSQCGDGPRFFDADVDIKSTQPLEQLLGTLGQTSGYTEADGPNMSGTGHGGRAWKTQLRATSTKSIVIVTDDNSRLSADDFLHFAGGKNPNNDSYVLPPGILDPSWNGLFDSWAMNGILGAPENDSTVVCTYPDGSTAADPPLVYASLITQSNGKRRSICDGATAWNQFFSDVIGEVATTANIDCTIPVPAPPQGQSLDPSKVNVSVDAGGAATALFHVDNAASCDPAQGGWYYDDDSHPTTITLCTASCTVANQQVGVNKSGSLDVTFGCATIEKP